MCVVGWRMGPESGVAGHGQSSQPMASITPM
jgi:hypothetical protein